MVGDDENVVEVAQLQFRPSKSSSTSSGGSSSSTISSSGLSNFQMTLAQAKLLYYNLFGPYEPHHYPSQYVPFTKDLFAMPYAEQLQRALRSTPVGTVVEACSYQIGRYNWTLFLPWCIKRELNVALTIAEAVLTWIVIGTCTLQIWVFYYFLFFETVAPKNNRH